MSGRIVIFDDILGSSNRVAKGTSDIYQFFTYRRQKDLDVV